MAHDKQHIPRRYFGVMVSSTFTDLEKHRAALIKAIKGQGLTDVAMENDSAKPDVDVIDSSLQMVAEATAYVAILSHKYGQTPLSPDRNPHQLSITELEFNEAQRLGRPILLFIMGDSHDVRKADVEIDPAKIEKLNAFRERAKQMKPDSSVHRVYATFDSLEEFTAKAIQAVAGLRRYLDEQEKEITPLHAADVSADQPDPIPVPPAFYAEPPYIGSHDFVGRQAQLDILHDWAAAADPHPILLFDAIGGSGKSMLTWEWIRKYSAQMRRDWAGRFWYSFYERGAVMADFCARALAYMTRQPLQHFRKMKTLQLSGLLIHQLQSRPWLIVLDGLERVLVAYHRFDAAQVSDDEVNQPTDQIAHRDPCAAIRPEDDDLLRALCAAAPSKLLITSRLIPRVFLNPASQPIPGVRRESLPGLRPADAEALLRSCQITGSSQIIQNYLKSHCDCHPLVTGVLAGLINDYLPNKGNFDAWAADPSGGGQLNLANLDLVQKRNHILKAALDALPETSRQLLSTLALLSEAVDYTTLSALNPHLPPEPEPVEVPSPPGLWLDMLPEDEKKRVQEEYAAAAQRRKEYEQALEALHKSPEFQKAPQELMNTVRDLERRGLLQYDAQSRRHDLHPVVRGIAAGALQPEETARYGQRVVDHFSQQADRIYEQAETLEELRNGIRIVQTLLKMDRYQQARNYIGDLTHALMFNIEAYAEILALVRPFFPKDWMTLPNNLAQEWQAARLANTASLALGGLNEWQEAIDSSVVSLLSNLRSGDWPEVHTDMINIAYSLGAQNRLARQEQFFLLGLDVATLLDQPEELFRARYHRFGQLCDLGKWAEAEATWQLLHPMGRNWNRAIYRQGAAETAYAHYCFWKGTLEEEHLALAEQLAKTGRNRRAIRSLHSLRGEWLLEQGQWDQAVEHLDKAVQMARAIGEHNGRAEAQLALAKHKLGQMLDLRGEAEKLAQARRPFHRGLAELWISMGDQEQAKKHALLAYREAWADGEPYVYRYELSKAAMLLESLGVDRPELAPYNPMQDEAFFWEQELHAALEQLRWETKHAAEDPPPR